MLILPLVVIGELVIVSALPVSVIPTLVNVGVGKLIVFKFKLVTWPIELAPTLSIAVKPLPKPGEILLVV